MSPVLEVRRLAKAFGGQVALRDVDLVVGAGQIHAVLGENGAGKSTLIKILAGVHGRDGGEILVNGTAVPHAFTAAHAAAAGLAFVHQDLGLVESLSVAENVALETGYARRCGLVSHRRTEVQVGRLLAAAGVTVDPRALIGDLPQDQKVMVAVARALSRQARVVVLDEVSASLPGPDMARLATALKASRATGVAYVLVTHRLDEVFELADQVTVLRDGRVRASVPVAGTTHEELVGWIVGEPADSLPAATIMTASTPAASSTGGRARPVPTGEAAAASTVGLPPRFDHDGRRLPPSGAHSAVGRGDGGDPVLRVRGLTGPGLAAPVDLDVASGEIVGVCGLIGSGTRALAGLLGGAQRPTAGTASLDGHPLRLGDSRALRRAGCTFVPGDRLAAGAATTLTVRENLFLARGSCPGSGDGAIIVPRTERGLAARLSARFGVRPAGTVERTLDTLSGGNQQKVVVGRALRSGPRLLVLEDPTAGVDVGSRAELHRLVRSAAAEGAAVVLLSTDFDEIAALSHRVLVLAAGRVTTELTGDLISPEHLATHSYAVPRSA